jgi:hypothetical protein
MTVGPDDRQLSQGDRAGSAIDRIWEREDRDEAASDRALMVERARTAKR